MRRFVRNVGHALSGLGYGLRTQRHVRFHVCAAAAVIAAAFWFRITPAEWAIVLVTIAAVIAAELVNTAVETVVDMVSPDRRPEAKAAKDTAAAAVLVTAIAAAAVGVLVFGPYAWRAVLG